MKRFFIFLSLAAAILLSGSNAVSAQTSDRTTAQIAALRNKIIETIKRGDRGRLETLYADDFTHTHATGQVDDKQKRLEALLAGDATIESVAPSEIKIRFYGRRTAVAVGQSEVENVRYRWTIVYFKIGKSWRVVASQATRIAEK